MNKYYSFILAFFSFFLFSCSSGDGDFHSEELGLFDDDNSFFISNNSLFFDYEGGDQEITIYSNSSGWRIMSGLPSFLSVSGWSGSGYGYDEITISATPNYSDEILEGEILIECGFKHDVIYVSQNRCTVNVVTNSASDITPISVVLNGTISGVNDSVEVGFYYGNNKNSLSYKTSSKWEKSGNFSISLGDLKQMTKYYYKAYAIVNGKEFNGEVQEFTTTDPKFSDDNNFNKDDFDSDIKI